MFRFARVLSLGLLSLGLLALAFSPSLASAATFTVNEAADLPLHSTASPCECRVDARGFRCTLRAALQAANACPGHDVVSLQPIGPFTLVIPGLFEDAGATGDLDVTEAVTVLGNHQWVRAAMGDRVLDVHPAVGDDVNLSELRLSHGMATGSASQARGGGIRSVAAVLTLDSVDIDSCDSSHVGGGLYAQQGEVTIIEGGFEGNGSVNDGAGAYIHDTTALTISGTSFEANESGGFGGGMVALHAGVAVIHDAPFETNSADRAGGGAFAFTSTSESVTFDECRFERNVASVAGGGLATQVDGLSSEVTITGSRFAFNRAYFGGAMLGAGVVDSSTFVGNSASSRGGAIALREEVGLYVNAPLVLENSTFYRNYAGFAGGALFAQDGAVEASHVTFEVNSAPYTASTIFAQAPVSLRSSIVSYPGGAPTVPHCNVGVSVGHNVATDLSCLSTGTDTMTSIVGLGTYANHGGPTPTVSLTQFSPAIDHGDPATCPALDQRGQPRPAGACDSGAYERQPGR